MIIALVTFINRNKAGEDFLIRMGGDEFLLVIPGANNVKATGFMAQMERELVDFNQTFEEPLKLRFSYGVESLTENMTIDQLIENADKRMYAHKQERKSGL